MNAANTPQPTMIDAIERMLNAARERAVDEAALRQIEQTHQRLVGPLRVAIAGKVKAGKSTLLNALVGEELAPTDSGECTSIVTWYSEGEQPAVTLRLRDGTSVRTTYDRDGGALNVGLAGRTPVDVDSIHVRWPTSRLRNLALIDTPGMESLSADLSGRALHLLTPEDERPPEVDAVLYLLRHVHASDAHFLDSFHETDLASGTPLNTVGVLARADEIGSCRLDALEVAARVADRYRAEPRMRRLCPVIVPVAGLLGHAGVTLREHEYRSLSLLARAEPSEVEEILLTADRFVARELLDLPSLQQRRQLLERLGLFGVRLSVKLIRSGEVRTSVDLSRELIRRSGLSDLRSVLLRQFAERSKILKARSALLAFDAILREGGCNDHSRLLSMSEEIVAGAHAFEELRLLDLLRADELIFNQDRRDELERLLGGAGHDAATRLGLAPDCANDKLRSGAEAALERWQAIAEHPLSRRTEQLAARGACRTLEGILVDLVQ